MITVSYQKCTACGACAQSCPSSCIKLQEDENGFLFPVTDLSQCIGCNSCNRACPLESNVNTELAVTKAYAAVNTDTGALMEATSGGAFSAIAQYVLSLGGIVYGCAYQNHLAATHIRVNTKDKLLSLNGSKYIQSNTADSFSDAEKDLKADKWVLYSGTPCQIAGLKKYLGTEYKKLITVDIICHGVPSQAYFNKYLEWYEKKNGVVITDFNFRSKDNAGWSYAGTCSGTYLGANKPFKKKINYFDSYYYFNFLSGDIYRESCYTCDYANLYRMGDFTLGDLWGAEGLSLPFPVKGGCSLILANTKKAAEILFQLKILKYQEIPIETAVAYNAQLKTPSRVSSTRDELLRQYRECSAEQAHHIFKISKRLARLKGKLKYSVPSPVKDTLLKIKYQH